MLSQVHYYIITANPKNATGSIATPQKAQTCQERLSKVFQSHHRQTKRPTTTSHRLTDKSGSTDDFVRPPLAPKMRLNRAIFRRCVVQLLLCDVQKWLC